MTNRILVTGATGNVGGALIDYLTDPPHGTENGGVVARAAVWDPNDIPEDFPAQVEIVRFDFADSQTYGPALEGVNRIFLMRPPAITDIDNTIKPFVDAAAEQGIQHISFLSLLGAEKNRVVPHRAVEELLKAGRVPYTLLRAGFFMQNLDTTHRAEIRDHNEIFIPAGKGKTSFTDVRDLAAVAAKTLTEPGHAYQAYPLTGEEALSYYEVADIMSDVLGRRITYTNPNPIQFAWRHWRNGSPLSYVGVISMIYLTTRLGFADTITPDVRRLLGRAPRTLRQYVQDYQQVWQTK